MKNQSDDMIQTMPDSHGGSLGITDRSAANQASVIGRLDYSNYQPFILKEARPADFDELAANLSYSDRSELDLMAGDWRTALDYTCHTATTAFAVRNLRGAGVMVLGTTEVPSLDAHTIWMLQSEGFRKSASITVPTYAIKLKRAASMLLNAHVAAGQTLFNLVPASQTETIRWLRQIGLHFYSDPFSNDRKNLLFGVGPGVPGLAASADLWKLNF